MRKNRIRLTESQLQGLIKKTAKKIINEGGHLTWKDDNGRMHTNSRDTWYGVEGSTIVSHGEWSDGEIYFDYQGEQYVINANDAEQWLWDDFKDYCQENNLNPNEHTDDEIWENFASSEAYDVLLNLGPYNENYEMNESKKRKIKLTESQLHRVIKESVKRVLREGKKVNNIPLSDRPQGKGENYYDAVIKQHDRARAKRGTDNIEFNNYWRGARAKYAKMQKMGLDQDILDLMWDWERNEFHDLPIDELMKKYKYWVKQYDDDEYNEPPTYQSMLRSGYDFDHSTM